MIKLLPDNTQTLFNLNFFFSFIRYTKYLYPYECEMKRLSTPTELQQAIDGNKREGRRSGYDTYSMFPGPRPQVPLPPSSLPMPQISPLPPGLRPSSNGFPGFPGSLRKLLSNLFIATPLWRAASTNTIFFACHCRLPFSRYCHFVVRQL